MPFRRQTNCEWSSATAGESMTAIVRPPAATHSLPTNGWRLATNRQQLNTNCRLSTLRSEAAMPCWPCAMLTVQHLR